MRAKPRDSALRADGRATILFKGPDAYVSPEHAGERNWGPTWNYAQIKVGADVLLDEGLTEWSLQLLIDAMESGRAQPWAADEQIGRASCRERVCQYV